MTSWPGAFTTVQGKTLKVLESRVGAAEGEAGAPGTVVAAGKQGIEVACGQGTLRILRAQVEGRKPLGAAELTGGRTLAAGMLLGGSPPPAGGAA